MASELSSEVRLSEEAFFGAEELQVTGPTNRASGGVDTERSYYEEFHLLDEVNEDENDDQQSNNESFSSESDVPEEEIDALLEEGLPEAMKRPIKRRRGLKDAGGDNEDFSPVDIKRKRVLIEKGCPSRHFDILPEGWLKIMHYSGMPIYFHKATRVCTLSKPYYLGSVTVRRHDIPLSSVPCLQYKRAMTSENKVENDDALSPTPSKEAPISSPVDASVAVEIALVENSDADPNGEVQSKETPVPTAESNPLKTALSLDELTAEDNLQVINNTKIETSIENLKPEYISHEELYQYCNNLFEFATIHIPKFNSWQDRRRYQKKLKENRQPKPQFPEGARLISLKTQGEDGSGSGVNKEWLLNPKGKSYICILHEYVQRALKLHPHYVFHQLENAATPYGATIMINNMKYATGYGSSKKQAKLEAARATLEILLPELGERIRKESNTTGDEDLEFFDQIRIEDPRVQELCTNSSEMSPYAVLLNCLQRNFGLSGASIECKLISQKNQKNEFCMTVGKHSVKVQCRNKKDGKQKASQAILQKLHPYIKNWGSLLRLYGNRSMQHMRERKAEEQEITLLQSNATINQPNTSIINKLRQEMLRLHDMKKSVQSIGKFQPPEDVNLPSSGVNLNSVDI